MPVSPPAMDNLDYANLKPADAVHHLNERLAAEVESFERATSLKLQSVKVKRDKEADTLVRLESHVR